MVGGAVLVVAQRYARKSVTGSTWMDNAALPACRSALLLAVRAYKATSARARAMHRAAGRTTWLGGSAPRASALPTTTCGSALPVARAALPACLARRLLLPVGGAAARSTVLLRACARPCQLAFALAMAVWPYGDERGASAKAGERRRYLRRRMVRRSMP